MKRWIMKILGFEMNKSVSNKLNHSRFSSSVSPILIVESSASLTLLLVLEAVEPGVRCSVLERDIPQDNRSLQPRHYQDVIVYIPNREYHTLSSFHHVLMMYDKI